MSGFRDVLRALAIAGFLLAVCAQPANAVLVYQRPAMKEIVAARDDGSDPHVIAWGSEPVVSPDGRKVGFIRHKDLEFRIVGIHGGQSRLWAYSAWLPNVWSPDSRHVAVASDNDAVLIDLPQRRRRHVPMGLQLGGASFSPDSAAVLLEDVDYHSTRLVHVRLANGRGRTVGGFGAVWGAKGIALHRNGGIVFKRDLNARARFLRHHRAGLELQYPVAWSMNGEKLLIVEGKQNAVRPVLVKRRSARGRTWPQVLTSIAALSRNGKVVLGEQDGKVVAARRDGSIRVLARGATSPSWTK